MFFALIEMAKPARRQRLDQIESEFQPKCVFLSENAWEEIETWVLAGLDLPGEWRWQVVRKKSMSRNNTSNHLRINAA